MSEATMTQTKLADNIRQSAYPLTGKDSDYDRLLDWIGDARFVLIGEATHGTQEFYQQRAVITQRLIQEKGFSAVAVEADWPDAYRVNRYVQGLNDDTSSEESLRGFQRFPSWMWRNTVVVNFIDWLRQYNHALSPNANKIGFYGLDLYSMYTSIEEVLNYLEKIDPEAAERARYRYACFDHFGEDSQSYGYAASFGLIESCEHGAINQLLELQRRMAEYIKPDGKIAEDEFFDAEQNARLIKNAEEYYRLMFQGRVSSWNLRDRHMAETLDQLVEYLDKSGQRTKIVVWEHNSHLGDARATDMGKTGEFNLGQLVRQRYGHDAVLVGLTTYVGSVTAASHWDGMAERKQIRPALADSYEALFHKVGMPRLMLNLRDRSIPQLSEPRLERAIGVIYHPQTERISHYFSACLPEQFDIVLHFDETQALEPLERTPKWHTGEAPETFPSAL